MCNPGFSDLVRLFDVTDESPGNHVLPLYAYTREAL